MPEMGRLKNPGFSFAHPGYASQPNDERGRPCGRPPDVAEASARLSGLMPAVIPSVMPAPGPMSIRGLGNGVYDQDCSQNGPDNDRGDHRTVGVARRRGCDCTCGDDRRRAESQKRFSH